MTQWKNIIQKYKICWSISKRTLVGKGITLQLSYGNCVFICKSKLLIFSIFSHIVVFSFTNLLGAPKPEDQTEKCNFILNSTEAKPGHFKETLFNEKRKLRPSQPETGLLQFWAPDGSREHFRVKKWNLPTSWWCRNSIFNWKQKKKTKQTP